METAGNTENVAHPLKSFHMGIVIRREHCNMKSYAREASFKLKIHTQDPSKQRETLMDFEISQIEKMTCAMPQ